MNKTSLSILIIEDNAQLAANIYDYLEACGHALDAAPDGVSGLNLAATKEYDAIVLDWNLPRMDGLTVLRRLRTDEKKTVPVIMLTARDQLADKIDGFESGVDDYLVKPVALPELEIRLRSLVARLRQSVAPDHVLTVADLSFNLRTLQVARGSRQVQLSRTSRALLELLMRRDGPWRSTRPGRPTMTLAIGRWCGGRRRRGRRRRRLRDASANRCACTCCRRCAAP